MRRSRKRDHLTVEKGDAAMTRPSPAPRRKATRRPTAPILTTVETCVVCQKRLPAKRRDNPIIAAGMFCPVCDKALCLRCSKKRKVFDEESPYAKHLHEDMLYARNRAYDELQFDIDDGVQALAAIEHWVDDRVVVMTHAAHPIESMKRLMTLARARRDIAPMAYAQDQMVMARLMLLYLRGEFDAPREGIVLVGGFEEALVRTMAPTYGLMDHLGGVTTVRPIMISPVPILVDPSPAYSMADGENEVAPPATLRKPSRIYVTPTDPGMPDPRDSQS